MAGTGQVDASGFRPFLAPASVRRIRTPRCRQPCHGPRGGFEYGMGQRRRQDRRVRIRQGAAPRRPSTTV